MKDLSGYLDDAYLLFLSSPINCCFPQEARTSRAAPRIDIRQPMRYEDVQQPQLIPPPLFASLDRPSSRGREWVTRTKSFASRASSRGSFSVRRKLNAYNGPRRPRIGPPLDFRLVENSTPRRTERPSFRPLELSIYSPDNRLSSLLPYFGVPDEPSTPWDNQRQLPQPPAALVHSRSESILSFQIPRKPVRSGSGTSTDWSMQFKARPESIGANELLAALDNPFPKAPAPARLRSSTEPPSYERLREAIHEKFELEHRLKDIEEMIEERKSIYLSSRPTSRAGSQSGLVEILAEEPLPPLPPKLNFTTEAGPSYPPVAPVAPYHIRRVALPLADQRPKTAPPRTVLIPSRLKTFTEASAAFSTSSPSSPSSTPQDYSPIPPPPLPLVLQAPQNPLQKKKSFGRVSNWLFPSSSTTDHTRTISLDSVTNSPKPITTKEGFYKCIDPNQSTQMMSNMSVSTVSTLETDMDRETLPTPEGSPGSRSEKRDVTIRTMSMDSERNDKSIELSRIRTFGEKEIEADETWRLQMLMNRNSVGVAF